MSRLTPDDITLLDDTVSYIRRFVVLSDEAAAASALWVAHTHAIGAAAVTPYLHLMSADKESGKTTLYDVLGRICARPWQTAHATAAAIRRGLNTNPPPTLMIDEVETVFALKGDDFLRGVLDAGFRRGATVTVLESKTWAAQNLSVFGPKLFAGLGILPDTVEGRSIPILMKRKLPTDQVDRARERTLAIASEPLRTRYAAWAEQCTSYLSEDEPALPEFLSSRQMDFWEPLLSIADLFGMDWPERSRSAAEVLHSRHIEDSEGIELLRDLRDVFNSHEQQVFFSEDLVAILLDDEQLRWKHVEFKGRSYPLDPWHLARILREYEIRPRVMRIEGKQARGYWREAFEDAWKRQLG